MSSWEAGPPSAVRACWGAASEVEEGLAGAGMPEGSLILGVR